MRFKIFLILYLLILIVIISFNPVNSQTQSNKKIASPIYSGHYSPGLINIRDFVTPPAGLFLLDYNIYLDGNEFYNKDGNVVTSYTGPLGATTQLSIDSKGYINVPAILYASKFKIAGGQYIAGIMPNYATVNTELALYRVGLIDTTPPLSGNVSAKVNGFGDLNVMPLYLSWHTTKLDFTAGYNFTAPTGKYTTGGDDNVGLGYWTHALQAFGYLYPMRIKGKPSQALAVMLSGTLELNSKIKDVDVTPGTRFTVEYGISQYLSEKFEAAIMGGNNFQIGEDSGADVWWDKSVKDHKSYVGFQLGYWIVPQLYAAGKYSFNYGLKQRIKQNMFQLNLTFITGLLTQRKN